MIPPYGEGVNHEKEAYWDPRSLGILMAAQVRIAYIEEPSGSASPSHEDSVRYGEDNVCSNEERLDLIKLSYPLHIYEHALTDNVEHIRHRHSTTYVLKWDFFKSNIVMLLYLLLINSVMLGLTGLALFYGFYFLKHAHYSLLCALPSFAFALAVFLPLFSKVTSTTQESTLRRIPLLVTLGVSLLLEIIGTIMEWKTLCFNQPSKAFTYRAFPPYVSTTF